MSLRTKVSRSSLKKENLLQAQTEKVEMTLNTDSAVASGLLIQRLTELYEDPVEASVRETVSNALDAVAESFSGEHPEVHIISPTSLNPVFTVKDNGVGMNYNDLKEIYSKYGASTKMDNFDQIGAYGLGAKAPLAYGTEFTVTSIKDGQKTTIIVAREELTNYIKIVDSVETDEPSGTTVSIPVDSGDIERFNNHIEKYKENPIDKDVKIIIDGEEVDGSGYAEVTDEVLIFEDGNEKIYGRLWVKKKQDTIVDLIANMSEDDIRRSLQFIIGGWTYASPVRRERYYRNSSSGIIVELKAGIVGFNSSRDAILENDRYRMLENLVIEYFKSDKFMKDLTKVVNSLELETFKSVVMSLLKRDSNLIKIKDGEIAIDAATTSYSYYSRRISREYSISDFIHDETKFSFDHIIKGVPKSDKQTAAILETKEQYKKTVSNSIFLAYENDDGEDIKYNRFSGNNLSTILEELDKIMFGLTNSHSLEVLMLNLALTAYTEASDRLRITFITDVEADPQDDKTSYAKLRPARKATIRMRNKGKNDEAYQSYVIYTEHSKADIQKMIKIAKFDDLDISIESAEDMLEKIKKFRKKNKTTPRKVNKNLSTEMLKFNHKETQSKRIEPSDIEVKDGVKNIIVVSREGYISNIDLKMIHSWYCNEFEVEPDEIQIYSSTGRHRVLDVEILRELGEMWENPRSKHAGTSKTYDEAINGKVVGFHTINERDKDVEKKAFIRVLSGFLTTKPTNVMSQIISSLEDANKLAEIAEFDMPEIPKDKLEELGEFGVNEFGDSYIGRNWRTEYSTVKHLFSNIDKDKYRLIESLVSLTSSSSLTIKEDGEYNLDYFGSSAYMNNLSQVQRAYEEGNENHSYHKMIRIQTEAYLQHIKDIVEGLSTLDF